MANLGPYPLRCAGTRSIAETRNPDHEVLPSSTIAVSMRARLRQWVATGERTTAGIDQYDESIGVLNAHRLV